MGLAFFGLTLSHRFGIFNQIHEIVYHGNGGYSWVEVYNMPIWLRNFTFNKIKDFHEKQNKQPEEKENTGPILGPNISPSYSTKASKN